MDLLMILLTSGATVALVKIADNVIMWALGRKAAREDRAAGKTESDIARRDREITDIQSKLAVLTESQKVNMHDRIKYLGRNYIKAGTISLDDREDLVEMHEAYHALGGNGHLDALMGDVMRLPLNLGGRPA